jgi:putative zinc finger/helix-turn-helix YgiT family protein
MKLSNNFRKEKKMRKCQVCGSNNATRETVPYHIEELLGMRVGVIESVQKDICTKCGEEVITIPDVNGLIAAVAVTRVMLPLKLNGTEIKFLRKAIGLSGKNLAELLGVRPETVSRWENNDAGTQIGSSGEKLFRIIVGQHIKEGDIDKAPAVDFNCKQISEMAINPLRIVDEKPLLSFERVKVKINRKTQEAWDEPLAA